MAAVDYFLKIKDIPGESQDEKHKGEIEMQSWSWGVSNTGTSASGGGSGAGKSSPQDFHFVMNVSKASPKLMQACANGAHLDEAIVIARKAGKGQQEYLKWTFTEGFVSSYQTGGSGHSDVTPTDQISLNFAKVQIDYKEQDKGGTLKGPVTCWYDWKQNKFG